MGRVHCHALEDSPDPKGLQEAWGMGRCAQRVEQRAAPSKLEGVEEKLVQDEYMVELEKVEGEWRCRFDGLEVGSSLEVGWGWCHLAGEVDQGE